MPVTIDEARAEMRNEIALTERWTFMRPHRMQSLLVHHPARFKWAPAGRRSGKTETAKRDTVAYLLVNEVNGSTKQLIGAPTYTRVKDIFFNDFYELIPRHWIKRIKESTQEIEFKTHWNATIRLVGMNKPQVVEGVPWNRCKFDELADYPPNCFEKHILPALSTEGQKGSAWFFGVPDEQGPNQAEYEKYYEIGLRWPEQREHCSFWWPSTDILSPQTVAEMAATMDPVTYRQEILGQFVRSGSRAFPASPYISEHYAEYCPFLPIDYTLDFGTRPACSLICQHFKDQCWVLDEIALGDGSTDAQLMAFIDVCGERGYDLYNGLNIYGDAAGRTPNSNTGESDYAIVRAMLAGRGVNANYNNLIHNPFIKDTVNAVRVKMSDWRGKVTLAIHPRCVELIKEIKSAPWPDKLKTFHRLAALRYWIFELYGEKAKTGLTGMGRASMLSQNQRISAKYTREIA